MFDTEKFIRCVRANPAIWDRRSKDYVNRQIRQTSWEVVGKRMYKNWDSLPEKDQDHKVYEMRNRWRHVRDAYARHVNSTKTKGGKNKRKYVYSDILSFLPTKWSSSQTASTTVLEKDINEIENESHVESDDSSQDHILSSSNQQLGEMDGPSQGEHLEKYKILTPASPNLFDAKHSMETDSLIEEVIDPDLADSTQYSVCSEQRRKKSRTTKSAMFASQMSTLEEVESLRQIEIDPDRAFLFSLLPDIKRLDDDEKLDFRIHVLQFIRNIRKKRLLEHNTNLNMSIQHEEIHQSENVLKKDDNLCKVEYDTDTKNMLLYDSSCN